MNPSFFRWSITLLSAFTFCWQKFFEWTIFTIAFNSSFDCDASAFSYFTIKFLSSKESRRSILWIFQWHISVSICCTSLMDISGLLVSIFNKKILNFKLLNMRKKNYTLIDDHDIPLWRIIREISNIELVMFKFMILFLNVFYVLKTIFKKCYSYHLFPLFTYTVGLIQFLLYHL